MTFLLKLKDGQIIEIPVEGLDDINDPWNCCITTVGTRDVLFMHPLPNGDNSKRLFKDLYEAMNKYPVTDIEEVAMVLDPNCYYLFSGGIKALYYRDMNYMNAGHLEFRENFSIRFNFDIENQIDYSEEVVKCDPHCPHLINNHRCKKYDTSVDGIVCEKCFIDSEQTGINLEFRKVYQHMHELYEQQLKK